MSAVRLRGLLTALSAWAVVCAAGAGRAGAADTYWNAAAGNWSDAGKWIGGEPTASDRAYVGSTAGGVASGTVTIDQAGETCDYLFLGGETGTSGGAAMAGGSLDAQTGIWVGAAPGAIGQYALSSGLLSVGGEVVGDFGDGRFHQTGGSHVVTADLVVGSWTGSAGSFALSVGALDVGGDLIVGWEGTGSFDHAGGQCTVQGSAWIGLGEAGGGFRLNGPVGAATLSLPAGGSINVAGGRLEWLDGLVEFLDPGGVGGQGVHLWPGATLAMGRGLESGATEFDVNALVAGAYFAGDPAGVTGLETAALEVTNGVTARQDSGDVLVGELLLGGGHGAGTYRLTGTCVLSVGARIRVGGGSDGRLEWYGGDIDTPEMALGPGGALAMGFGFDLADLTAGDLFLFGGSLTGLDAAALEVGRDASAAQTSGTVEIGRLQLGGADGTAGYYDLFAGELRVTQADVGTGGAGLVTQWGGSVEVTGTLTLGSQVAIGSGYELISGSLSAGGIACRDAFAQSGGALQADRLINEGQLLLSAAAATTITYVLNRGSVMIDGAQQVAFGDVVCEPAGSFTAAAGDRVHVSGDFLCRSAQAAAWSTDAAALLFEPGEDDEHVFAVTGVDLGPAGGWTGNFVWGELTVQPGQHVSVADGDAGVDGGGALYVHTLTLAGVGSYVGLGPSMNLYYRNGGGPKQLFGGDANLDGSVNILDLGALANNYRGTDRTWAEGDFNGDAAVNILDLGALANNYRRTTGGGPGGEPVPEPVSACLWAAGLGALLLGPRRASRRRGPRPGGCVPSRRPAGGRPC